MTVLALPFLNMLSLTVALTICRTYGHKTFELNILPTFWRDSFVMEVDQNGKYYSDYVNCFYQFHELYKL